MDVSDYEIQHSKRYNSSHDVIKVGNIQVYNLGYLNQNSAN